MMGSHQEEIPDSVEDAQSAGIIDFAPRWLSADATLGDANRLLAEATTWGVPLLDGDAHYVGMLTLRSLLAAALPVVVDEDPLQTSPIEPAGIPGKLRLARILDRPARLHLDLEVPVVRRSTRVPQLLAALCRRSPMVPIVADTGMRLIGVASLDRAAKALYGR